MTVKRPVLPGDLDKTIHERGRLAIMSALAATAEMTFAEMKDATGLTDGNLSVHSRVLQDAGYVKIKKSFVGLKPQTVMEMTAAGRTAFENYLDQLEMIVRRGRKDKC